MIDCNAIPPEGYPVRFQSTSGVYGTRGIVSIMPGLKFYIVELESSTGLDLMDYPYSCIAVPNEHLGYSE